MYEFGFESQYRLPSNLLSYISKINRWYIQLFSISPRMTLNIKNANLNLDSTVPLLPHMIRVILFIHTIIITNRLVFLRLLFFSFVILGMVFCLDLDASFPGSNERRTQKDVRCAWRAQTEKCEQNLIYKHIVYGE